MPIYVYRCEKCGKEEEKLGPPALMEDAPPPCADEDCDGQSTRVPATTSFQLKGGGWFKDSYPD